MRKYYLAVVEDDGNNVKQIVEYISLYAASQLIEVEVTPFSDGESFQKTQKHFDVVFMDIELPGTDGITCSKILRKTDKNALIVFITNLSQFAVRGYEVSAFDFIVKPLIYSDFAFKLQRIFTALSRTKSDSGIRLENKDSIELVAPEEIVYIEIDNHYLVYHLLTHNFMTKGNLNDCERQFASFDFLRCNRCYLVNPCHIKRIEGYSLVLTNAEILISRPQRKTFMHAFNEYLSRRGG